MKQISENGKNLIKEFEQCRLKAYLDSVGIPTIGWGNTFYQDGTKVKLGDKISQQQADTLFDTVVSRFADKVSSLTTQLNQNQFDALVSFAYNVGVNALANSTLLKKINKNPLDSSIRNEFLRWNKAGGKVLKGLTKRRKRESDLYFR